MTIPSPTGPANQRWALVTGASAGIGAEFCRQLAAQGHALVLLARRRERLESLAEELRSRHGVETLVLTADLADPQAPAHIAATLDDADIEIDFLVNNAGYGVPGRLVEVDWATHEQFLRVMVTAVCELTWRFLPGMQRRGRGCIINVASVAGLVPGSEGHTLYGASKAFLVRFSESLALEADRHGVQVSALCPGFTYSEFHDVTGTRDQVSQLPGYLWLQAEDVVAYAIDSVRRHPPRVVAVPGRVYRLLVWLSGALPGLGRYLTRRSSHRFRKLD
jgi:short-subunit dehydrogenase